KPSDWKATIKKRAAAKTAGRRQPPTKAERDEAEAELRKEREGEIEAVLAGLRAGGPGEAWARGAFTLAAEMDRKPITKEYVETADECRIVKLKTLLTDRCVRCHKKEGGDDGAAAKYPLENYEQWKPYVAVKGKGAMSLTKLAQTTHVHL